MKIVYNTTTNIVIFVGEDLTLSEEGVTSAKFRASNIKPDKHILVEIETDEDVKGGKYLFDGSTVVKTDEYVSELNAKSNAYNKQVARDTIRDIKDIEDDLVDQKQLVQFIARGFAGLWVSLPEETKEANPYKDNFNAFCTLISEGDFRIDLEPDQASKIASIMKDESDFAQIVQDEYLSKVL